MKQRPLFHKTTTLLIPLLMATCCLACNLGSTEEKGKDDKSTTAPTDVSSTNTAKKSDTIIPRTFKALELQQTIQSYTSSDKDPLLTYDPAINSPKSVNYSADGTKFYVQSLEGYTTVVYDAMSLKKIKEIKHVFNQANASLFKNGESTVFDYTFKQNVANYNYFSGKPVESCFSHEGRYLWVTYYRRDYDARAESPSAVAIIDTKTDEIVRVMPSGPLPKMIACSNNNKYIIVTHWGDNTVGIIDISSSNVNDFTYIKHINIDERLSMNFSSGVNRDEVCGNCLRGTIFTPDDQYILIAKMGGNGIAVVRVSDFAYVGTITGSLLNLRHLIIKNNLIYASSNKYGAVQRMALDELYKASLLDARSEINPGTWETARVGTGARTIEITPDGQFVFACVNNEAKIVVVDTRTMKEIYHIPVSKFPVGMALSKDGNQLIITSQGRSGTGGNAVNVFKVIYE